MRRLILAALASALALFIAAPGGQSQLTLTYQGGQIAATVEQQSPNFFFPPCNNGSGPQAYELTGGTGQATGDTITKTAHGLGFGWHVTFTSLTGGSGLVVGQPYYVTNSVTANTFQVSTTIGGDPVNITADYSDVTVRTGCDSSLWVTNPLVSQHCGWDVDDHFSHEGFGLVNAGTTATGQLCVVADQFNNYGGDDHMVVATVYAPSNDLTVGLANDYGWSQGMPPVAFGGDFKYETCHVDHTPGPYPTIAGSNGGTGLVVTYTLSVSAPVNKTVRSVAAYLKTILVGSPAWNSWQAAGCV